MRYYDLAKCELYSYKANVEELARLKQHLAPITVEVKGFTKGRVTKPVEMQVLRLLADSRYTYLEKSIASVEYALEQVKKFSEGSKTIRLFELVYYHRTHTLSGAAMLCGISETTAKRYNIYLVKCVAVRMGYIPTK